MLWVFSWGNERQRAKVEKYSCKICDREESAMVNVAYSYMTLWFIFGSVNEVKCTIRCNECFTEEPIKYSEMLEYCGRSPIPTHREFGLVYGLILTALPVLLFLVWVLIKFD